MAVNPSDQTPLNQIPSSHPSFRVTSKNAPLCIPPTISLTNSASVDRLSKFFWLYHALETSPTWTNGIIYHALSLVNSFLLYNKESNNLEDIKQISFELTSACLTFLQSWTEDPILCRLVLDIYCPTHPAWYYYRTLFSVNIGQLVTTADGQQGILLGFYQNFYNDEIVFSLELPNQERRIVIVPASAVSAYDKYLSFVACG